MTLDPGTQVGPYRLGALLGQGGMAAVYEATQESVGRVVALKLMAPGLADPTFLGRFQHEGRMQAALEHPHVVTVYEAGASPYGHYLAMQLVRGTTLAGLIDDGVLTSGRTLELVGQTAEALDAAHAVGLVHRDVKPRNVLVDGEHAYLADFGLTHQGDGQGATAAGQLVGTIAYVAPEVVSGGRAGPAADRYALAAVLFECLTGTTPFPRPTHAAVLYAHTHEPPPRVSGRREGIPSALDEVLIAGLAKDPAGRPATAVELVERARAALMGAELDPPAPRVLSDARDDTTAGHSTLARSASAPSPARRRARGGIAAAAVAGSLAGAGLVALVDGDEPAGQRAPAAALPPAPAGSVRLGPDLTATAPTVDCHGDPVTDTSPTCTLFQQRLPDDTTLIVPDDGVVRRWAVRSARGELALSVIRDRDGFFQIGRSRNEFVADDGPHAFATDLAVERGDRLALVVIGGSGVGLREVGGGTTARFEPALAGLANPIRATSPGELQLRADYVPDAEPHRPRQLRGAAAATAPAGATLASGRVRFEDGVRAEVRLATVAGRGVLDLVREGKRVARVDVEDLHPPLNPDAIVAVGVDDTRPEHLFVNLSFTRAGSQRVIGHYLEASGRRFTYFG